MSVVLPQVLVFQDFNTVPSEITDPLRPFICGPEYDLHRYTVASEKKKNGTYSQVSGNVFNWITDLGRTAGSNADLNYTKVYLENALLKYYTNSAAGDENTVCTVPAGYANRVNLLTNLKTANGQSRSNLLYTRDVQVGDYVTVAKTDDTFAVTAKIIDFVATPTSSTIDTIVVDSANATNGNGSVGTPSSVTGSITPTVSGSYDGTTVGVTHETYTIVFTQGSTGGDPKTAMYDVISSTGKDTQRNVVYSGNKTTIDSGTPANDAAFSINSSGLGNLTFQLDITSGSDIQRGWGFTVAVQGTYTAPTIASAGTYNGTQDTKYVVKVVRGGTISTNVATCPIIQVTTNNGYDTGGQQNITATGVYTIGNHNAQINLSAGTKLIYGDKWYVSAHAAGLGAVQTIVVDQTLNSTLIAASDLNVTFYMSKSVELPKQLYGNSTITNWTQDSTGVTLLQNAKVYVPEWRAGLYGLTVASGDIYIHWRALLDSHADKIYSIDQIGDISTVFSTPADPENPLVYGVEKALLNSNGTSVRFMAVATDDVAGYTSVIDKLEIRDDIYSVVPLTQNKSILDLFAGHVNGVSTPEGALWRVAFFSQKIDNPSPRLGVSSTVTGAISFNSTTGLYELSLLTPSDGSVNFLSTDEFGDTLIKSGDVVRYNFDLDNSGNTIYQTVTVDKALTSTKLQLLNGTTTAADTRFEVYRTLDSEDLAIKIGLSSGVFHSRRVYNIYPDVIASGGVDVPGYYLAAAIAGLVGGVVPHQGLTNVTITGFDNANNVVHKFNRSQLDSMANAGTWIVTHDLKTGEVYTRQELSTDLTDVNSQELMVTKNVDSISYLFKNNLRRFIGRANVTPRLLATISTEIVSTISYLQNNGFTNDLGSQLVDATIASIKPHPLLKDRIVVVLNLTVPYPLNNLECHLVI
jgi:hypothetical protein